MNQQELFSLLSEGKQNSLGKVIEVFDKVVAEELDVNSVYNLYRYEDQIVSMRVSNVLKRLWRNDEKFIIPLIETFIKDAKVLQNPTFRWTLSQIYKELFQYLTPTQKVELLAEVKRNLLIGDDWIMLAQSLDTLIFAHKKGFSIQDVMSVIEALEIDHRKVIRNKIEKIKNLLLNKKETF